MLEMANIHVTKRNGIILSYRGHKYCKNRTTQEKIHWRSMVRCCLAPLQSNIFTNDKAVQVLVGLELTIIIQPPIQRTISKKSDSEMKLRMNLWNMQNRGHDFMLEKIDAKPYDCIDSARNRSSSDIETVKICRYDESSDYDKVNLYCNAFNKYMKCVKEIEPPFLSSVLNGIDICSILNEKEKRKH